MTSSRLSAERIATLDVVSGGRVEFGTGESSSEAELGGFEIDPFVKREMWEEGLRVADIDEPQLAGWMRQASARPGLGAKR